MFYPIELAAKYYNKHLIKQYGGKFTTAEKNIAHERAILFNACTVGMVISGLFYGLGIASGRATLSFGVSFLLGRLVIVESFKGGAPDKPAEGNVINQVVATAKTVVTQATQYPFLTARPKAWIHIDTFVILYRSHFFRDLLRSVRG